MEYFNDQTNLIVTGYPTRLDLTAIPRDEAIAHFMLSPELPTLLVFGGSKGARSINQAILSILPELLKDLQVIHISGNLDWPTVKEVSNKLPGNIKDRYHSFPYLYKDMGAALNSADLVVSRAGAAVLGEFPLSGVPAILVPYPHAWRYQEINAHYLESRGAAIVMQDHELGKHLYSTINRLINDPQMLKEMSQAMSSLATPQAAESIANILQDLVHSPSSGRI
jgi:UDP-N-acetylglucosamine--N-acetylmuramyl-(pentapeptide) pyrophosphoryl-undecaprenol N-acetylglucosamine transferase